MLNTSELQLRQCLCLGLELYVVSGGIISCSKNMWLFPMYACKKQWFILIKNKFSSILLKNSEDIIQFPGSNNSESMWEILGA